MAENVEPSSSKQRYKSPLTKRFGLRRHHSLKEGVFAKVLGHSQNRPAASQGTRAISMDSAFQFVKAKLLCAADFETDDNSDPGNHPTEATRLLTSQREATTASSAVVPSIASPSANSSPPVTSPVSPRTPLSARISRRIAEPFSPILFPPERPILSVDVSIATELDNLDIEEERSIWTTVQITGHVKETNLAIPPTQLDIAVVLDTSAYASDETLYNACAVVMHIARLLDHPKDRMAIFCTSYYHPSGAAAVGCMVRSLKAIEVNEIQEELRVAYAARSSSNLSEVDLSETLAAAFRLLYAHSGMASRIGGLQYPRHVIIISSNPSECTGVLTPIAPVPVHIIQPGTVPWYGKREANDGWVIDTSCLGPIDVSPDKEIKPIIDHARSEITLGHIKKVVMDIRPAPYCRIEEIVGRQSVKVLLPGQVESLAVKVRVPGCKLSEAEKKRQKPDGLFQQLEGILGIARSELFTVGLKYKHSMFSQDTTLSTHATCSLERTSPSSSWSNPSGSGSGKGLPQQNANVHKQLMRCIATSNLPRQALTLLLEEFGGENYGQEVTMCLKLVKEELQYQSEVCDKYKLQLVKDESKRKQQEQEDLERRFPGRKLEREVSSSLGSQKAGGDAASTTSAITTIHNQQDPFTEGTGDEAREIWKLMRQDSKSKEGKPEGAGGDDKVEEDRVEAMKRMRELALQNKRSVGADTLRSLSGKKSG